MTVSYLDAVKRSAPLALVALLTLASCGGGGTKTVTVTKTVTSPTTAGAGQSESQARKAARSRPGVGKRKSSRSARPATRNQGAPSGASGTAPKSAAGGAPAAAPQSSLKAGPPTVVINGTESYKIYGPYKFKDTRYVITYRRVQSGPTRAYSLPPIFTVTMDRKRGVYDSSSLNAISTTQFEGTVPGLPVPGGKFYVRVAANKGASSYSITFAPVR